MFPFTQRPIHNHQYDIRLLGGIRRDDAVFRTIHFS
jgi:hypothetical protein